MNNSKLSLHIATKNISTLTSGFIDISVSIKSQPLTLNRQTVAQLGRGGNIGGQNERAHSLTAFFILCMPYFTFSNLSMADCNGTNQGPVMV